MQLRVFIKQTQQQDISGNNIYFQGSNVNTLSPVVGTLPFARQWRNFGSFIDVTDESGDVYTLALEWSAQDNRDNEGFIAVGTFNPNKTASGQINFEAEAYRLIKQWLIDDVSAQLNSVDVQIVHYDNNNDVCGTYKNWVVTAKDIEWCEDDICVFDTVIKQKDELYNCIKSTVISDNWQGWFKDIPDNGKKHPRFSYCNEIRPNGMLVMQWYLMSNVAFIIKIVGYLWATIINPLIFAINGIILVINAIIAFINALGANITPLNLIPFFNPDTFNDNIGNFFIEAAGCGREHPAPLIRDYIYNVCAKCGVQVDATSAPIFFSDTIKIETASRGTITHNNPHYRACYLITPNKKGIRRFNNLSVFGESDPNNTQFYIEDGRPLQTLDAFLDEIKGLYNAEWNLRNGVLYFQRKDFYRMATNPYVLDLSTNGADRNRLLQGICFTWNERKIPAYAVGLYSQDGIDTCGDEAQAFMNDVIQYGDASKNPVYDGRQDKTTQFGATKFRGDGVQTDYIFDAFQICVNGSWMSVFIGGVMFDFVRPALIEYADYALLMRDDKNALPKILIWDGVNYLNARAEKYYTGIDTFGNEPRINHNYNPALYGVSKGWSTVHPPQTYVRGRTLVFGSQTVGLYQARDLLGLKFYEMPAYLVNYPMYMGIGYEDSMWDWFHWIDDPNKRSVLMRTANMKIELCCDLLNRLKVFNDGMDIVLGERVLLPHGEGVITSIRVDYSPDSERGQHIEITADA